MNDDLDTILLERFSAQRDPLPGPDLADLRRRTPRRRPGTRRPAIAAAALIAAAIVSAAAYAVVRLVIVGSPAPPPVRRSEQLLQQVERSMMGFARFGRFRLEVAKTRAAAVLATSSGPVYLWMAPTTSGGRCLYLQITGLDQHLADGGPFLLAAGCVSQGQSQPLLHRVNTGVGGHTLALVFGYLPPPARTFELRFSDGTASRPVAIRNGFVLAQGSRLDPEPTAVALDGRGRPVDGSELALPQLFVSASPIGTARLSFTVPLLDHLGTLLFRVLPGADGSICTELRTPWLEGNGCKPSRDRAGADSIDVLGGSMANVRPPHQRIVLLQGEVGAGIASLQLRYQDGTQRQVPIHDGWVLYQIAPRNFARGRRPEELVGRDDAGKVVATRHGVGSGLFCFSRSCTGKVKVRKAPGLGTGP